MNKKNFIWNFLGLSINSFTSLLFLIIINQFNSSVDGGIFTYAYSLICLTYYIGLFFNRPYQIANPQKYSNKEFVVNRIISNILMILVTYVLTLIFKYNIYKTSIIMLICIYRMLESMADVLYGIEQSKGELYKSGISMSFKGIIGIISFMLIDYLTHNMLLAIASLVIINIIGIISYDLPNTNKYIEKSFNLKNIFNIYKVTIPIFVFSFLSNYLINSSKYTLDFYENAETQNIFGILLMAGTIMSLCAAYILNPYLLELKTLYKNNKYEKFDETLSRIIGMIIFIGIFLLILCSFIGIPILNFVYNIKLDTYKLDLILIIIGATFLGLVTILSNALTIFNKNNIQMYLQIINSIIAFTLSIILIKSMGLFGATLTYLIIMFLEVVEYLIVYNINYEKIKLK